MVAVARGAADTAKAAGMTAPRLGWQSIALSVVVAPGRPGRFGGGRLNVGGFPPSSRAPTALKGTAGEDE